MSIEEYTNPFSEISLKASKQFDNATLANDIFELQRLTGEIEPMIPDEDIASQAQFYTIRLERYMAILLT